MIAGFTHASKTVMDDLSHIGLYRKPHHLFSVNSRFFWGSGRLASCCSSLRMRTTASLFVEDVSDRKHRRPGGRNAKEIE